MIKKICLFVFLFSLHPMNAQAGKLRSFIEKAFEKTPYHITIRRIGDDKDKDMELPDPYKKKRSNITRMTGAKPSDYVLNISHINEKGEYQPLYALKLTKWKEKNKEKEKEKEKEEKKPSQVVCWLPFTEDGIKQHKGLQIILGHFNKQGKLLQEQLTVGKLTPFYLPERE